MVIHKTITAYWTLKATALKHQSKATVATDFRDTFVVHVLGMQMEIESRDETQRRRKSQRKDVSDHWQCLLFISSPSRGIELVRIPLMKRELRRLHLFDVSLIVSFNFFSTSLLSGNIFRIFRRAAENQEGWWEAIHNPELKCPTSFFI